MGVGKRMQMVQKVDGRHSVRVGGERVMMVRRRKKVCSKMLFSQSKVILDHVFCFFILDGKLGHQGPTHPILMENSISFFFWGGGDPPLPNFM